MYFNMSGYPNKIEAAVLVSTNKPLQVLEMKLPKLMKGQILVKVIYSGVCRSQLMECKGLRGKDKWLPHLLGHEGSGVVIKVGESVSKVSIGDEVILTWIECEGIDAKPAKYRQNKKVINAGKVTTFSNYTIVSENRVIKKPKKMPFDVAALFGCAFPTGAGMIINDLRFSKNDNVVVLGLGGIGMSALIALVASGIRNIIAVDMSDAKLMIAKRLGIKHTYNSKNEKIIDKIFKITNKGADYCIESAGSIKTIELGFNLINNKGTLLFASHPDNNKKISLYPHDLIKGKKIFGSWGGSVLPDRDIPKIYKLFKKTKVPYDALISKKYTLKDINIAMNDMNDGKVFRPLIKMHHEKN